MKKIATRSTSTKHAFGSDIILRETNTTRLVFRPEIVVNPNNESAPVRGKFLFAKKGIKGYWDDCKSLSLSSLKAGEWIQLELHCEEVRRLMEGLGKYRAIFAEHGIVFGEKEYVVIADNLARSLGKLLSSRDPKMVLEKLQQLDVGHLEKMRTYAGLLKCEEALGFWSRNESVADESIWQKEFEANSWIISQLFSYPVVILKDRAYVGGKGLSGTGGGIADFVFKNKLTKNIAIIEIKTPMTQLVASNYRGAGKSAIFSMTKELSGSLTQILNYKDKLQKDFYTIAENSSEEYYSFNPKCILIIGSTKEKGMDEAKLRSFELFRGTSKDVDIITFDELYEKVSILHKLMVGQD